MSISARDIEQQLESAAASFKSHRYGDALSSYTDLIRKIQLIDSSEIPSIREKYGLSVNPVLGPRIHPKLPIILDSRAATYEKLNDLKRALRDAENLVKIDPLGCKGYLRQSKILLSMGKELEAYKVLQRGNYTIDSACKKYHIKVPAKLLENLKIKYKYLNDKLKHQMKSKRLLDNNSEVHDKRQRVEDNSFKCIDPFFYLPSEIIERIFSYLPLKDVLRSHQVCSNWYQILIRFPSLYEPIVYKHKITKTEFMNGMKLIEKIYSRTSGKIVKSLKFRTTLNENFFLEAIKYLAFKSHLKFCHLELVNPTFSIGDFLISISHNYYKKIDKHGLKAFQSLEHLRLVVSSQTRHIPHLLTLSENLKTLEIIHMSENSSKKFESSIYGSIDFLLEGKHHILNSLQTLTHIGHPKKEGGPMPLLKQVSEGRFPNLKSLTLISQDLSGCSGTMLSKLFHLQEVYFENNIGYDLITFLCNFALELDANQNPKQHRYAKLTKLVFRERDFFNDMHLDNYEMAQFPTLATIQYLDLYGTSICKKGLYKLLEICNVGKQLHTLNIGGARVLNFPVDQLHRRSVRSSQNIIEMNQLLTLVPNLTRLYIPEIEFDNYSAKCFYMQLDKFGFNNLKLEFLDLTLCRIDGKGLMDLFCISNIKPITFRLEFLVLDGVDITSSTIQLLESRHYVRKVKCNPQKVKWREYGNNSLIIE